MAFESYMIVSIRHLVDDRCPYIVRNLAAIAADDTACDWLVRLTTKVMVLVETGVAVTANSTEFFKPSVLTPSKFWEDPACVLRRKNLPAAKVERTVLSYVRRVLYCWFGSETPFTAQARCAFVACLLRRFGEDSLRIPLVWDTYVEMPSWLFTRDCPRLRNGDTSYDSRFEYRFLDNLTSALDICDPGRTASDSFAQLGLLYESLHARTKTYTQDVLLSRTRGSALKRLVASLTSIVPTEPTRPPTQSTLLPAPSIASVSQTRGDLNDPVQPSPLASSSQTTNDAVHPAASPFPPARRSAVALVIRLLEDSHKVALALRGLLSEDELSPTQHVIFKSPDYLLPLREDAPCRRIMSESFDKEFARSRNGFFSLQIFRFIHFNSGAFRDYPSDLRKIQFNSQQAFDTYLSDVRARFPKEEEAFFCNKNALGQTIHSRKATRSGDYWIASRDTTVAWPPSRDFATARKNLWAFKKSVGETWAGVGALSCYLFVADLHYAGLVDEPTPQDIAAVISWVRKGGMDGLKALKYITDCSTKPVVEEKFLLYYSDVTDTLTEDQRDRFRWNPIVAEHTLCKILRLQGLGYYLD